MTRSELKRPGRLLLVGFCLVSVLIAQPPADWTVDEYAYENVMTVTARIWVDLQQSNDPTDVLGAFIGGECRGCVAATDLGDELIWFLTVRSGRESESVTFKVWDASLDSVLNSNNTTVFAPNASRGSFDNPFAVEALTGLDNTLPVELSRFVARAAPGEIVLEWRTESESENLGFLLERRVAPQSWNQIGSFEMDSQLAGQGTSPSSHSYSYVDESVQPDILYEYRLLDVAYDGSQTQHPAIQVESRSNSQGTIQIAPNPFNGSTTIHLMQPGSEVSSIVIYSLSGRTIRKLESTPGQKQATWDGLDDHGRTVQTGVFVCQVSNDRTSMTGKMLLIK